MVLSPNTSLHEDECTKPEFPACYTSREEFVGYMYIDAPLNLMGVITNTLNLMVFHERCFRIPVSAYLLLRAMAVADLLACAVIFPIGFCRCFPPSHTPWQAYLQQFYDVYLYLPFANFLGTVSIWLTVCVSIERYMSVAMPVFAKDLFRLSRARMLVAWVFIAAFAMNMPFFFLKEIAPTPPPRYTAWGVSAGADIYFTCRILLCKILPVLVVITVNVLLVHAIWSLNQRHKAALRSGETPDAYSSARTQARADLQKRVTCMVASISVVFITCHALEPFVHDPVFAAIFGTCNVYSRGHRIFIIYTNAMETFTYASNFFFYCFFNKQFAGALRRMCRCRCCETKVQDFQHSMTDYSVT